MPNRLTRKRRLARARRHLIVTRAKQRELEALANDFPAKEALVEQELFAASDAAARSAEQPSRTKCPSCGFSQKVRKDGTMSRHDVYLGDAPQECTGTGQRWDAQAA